MRMLLVLLGASTLGSAFASTIICPTGPIPVQPGLVVGCGQTVAITFGTNPLPDGGQLDVDSFSEEWLGGGLYSFNIGFGFPRPGKGTTELEFTVCCAYPYIGLSLEADGSDFSINEHFPGSRVTDLNLNGPGIATLGCTDDQFCYGGIDASGSLLVVTTITNRSGGPLDFSESFVTPEPSSRTLLAVGLLCVVALIRLTSSTSSRSVRC